MPSMFMWFTASNLLPSFLPAWNSRREGGKAGKKKKAVESPLAVSSVGVWHWNKPQYVGGLINYSRSNSLKEGFV